MKKIILLCVFCASAVISFAQQQTFDLTTFTPPKAWKKQISESAVQYSKEDSAKGTYCLITLYKAVPGTANSKENFDLAWESLVKEMVTVSTSAEMQAVTTENARLNDGVGQGWETQSGYAPFENDGNKGVVVLVTAGSVDKMVNLIILTNTDVYEKEMTAFLESVSLKRQETRTQQTQTPAATNNNTPVIGTWGISVVVPYRSGTEGTAGSNIRQYTFNANGTYSFFIKTFKYNFDKLLLTKETGTYQISGNKITISPQKSIIESWSKKDGTDNWDKLVSTQNKTLEKTSYQFTKHYSAGMQEWNLVLQANKETQRDGPYNGGTAFGNAWLYSTPCNKCLIELPGGQQIAVNEIKKKEPVQQPAGNGFVFTTTNFDDGWTSTVQEDWVQVTKGNIKVLLHYPNAVTGKYYSDSDEGISAAWNNLVAPRYNNLQNYTAWYSTSILPRPFVIAGNLTDKQTGKKLYVVLFRKGNAGWAEIISPDKNTFINHFGVDNTVLNNYPDSKLFSSLEKLETYNKFAIAATDLKGKWSDKFAASFFNYNTSDGQYTGTNTIAIVSNFNFASATAYKWDAYSTNNAHSAGAAKKFNATGTFKMVDNWQIHFSDIQGKPKTYNAYFTCHKAGRVLWLQDKGYGGYSPFGKID